MDVKSTFLNGYLDEEIECIEKNQTCELVDVPKDKDVSSVKWIYKTKQDVDGNV